jgi:predicted Zn-dependent protease
VLLPYLTAWSIGTVADGRAASEGVAATTAAPGAGRIETGMIAERRPVKPRRHGPAFRVAAVAAALSIMTLGATAPARAQADPARGLPMIRDAEIEQLMRDYTQPILRAAGLAQQNVRVVLINDRSFNAFVIDGRRIFVNAGAITDSQTPNQLIGVLAHETGHIAGGHLAKMRSELANAQTAAIISTLLGVGAMVGAARSGSSVGGNAGAVAMLAPQAVIMRSLLSYQRQQEEQADRAAVKFLAATNQSPRGMYDTFKRFADQIEFSARYADPYLQSHPMPKERVAALEEIARTSLNWDKRDAAELQLRHDLARAKLYGFLERPDSLLRRYPLTDQSLPARYARAISAYRYGGMSDALGQIDTLIHAQPNNPYFYEIKGQALLEAGRGREAIAPLRRALALAPAPALIEVLLGQALLASNDAGTVDEAIDHLKKALARDAEIPDGYAQLAIAYGRKGNYAEADLASAQAAFNRGDFLTARQLGGRAKGRFPVGSPGWVKSDDLASYRPPNIGPRRQ